MRRINKIREGTFRETSLMRSLLADYPEHEEWLLDNVPTDDKGKYYSVQAMENSLMYSLPFKEEIYIND